MTSVWATIRRARQRLPSSVESLAFVVILAAAAYLRLNHLDQVMFVDDETWLSQLAVSMVETHRILLASIPSSIGVNYPPTFIYLLAIPYALSRDPEVATGFIGLLGVVSVLGCYLVARRAFGVAAAVVASLLFAVSPWAVIYSRKIWQPDVMALAAVLFFSAMLAYLRTRRGLHLVLACVCLSLAVELHLSGVVLFVTFLGALLANPGAFRWRPLLIGALSGLATSLPFAVWQIENHWPDLQTVARFAGQPARWDLDAVRMTFRMIGSPGYVTSNGNAPFAWVDRIEGAVFVAGVAYALYQVALRRSDVTPTRRAALGVLLFWTMAPIVVFTRHSMDVNRHYFVVLFPAPFILIGVLASDVIRAATAPIARHRPALPPSVRRRIAVGLAVPFLAFFAVPQLYDDLSYHVLQWRSPTAPRLKIADVYNVGLPLGYERQIAMAMTSLGAGHPEAAIYLQSADLQKPSALRFLSGAPLDPKYLGSAGAGILVFPPPGAPDAVFITANGDVPSAALLRSLDPTALLRTMTYPSSDLRLSFYRLSGSQRVPALQELSLAPLSDRFANGVQLLGYRLPRLAPRGGTLPLIVAWRIGPSADTARAGYQFYAHLVDADGRSRGGLDALDYGSSEWTVGETVIAWYRIAIPPNATPGLYHVLIGMYDHEGTRAIPLNGPDGRVPGDTATLGPLKVTDATGLPTSRDAKVQHPQVEHLGDQVTLLGYDLGASAFTPGGVLPLTLHWVAGAARPDYTVFVHLVDSSGKLVAQVDSQPRGGKYPTSLWDPSEYVRDDYRLAVPSGLTPGTYRLVVGMYRLDTGQRVTVTDDHGRSQGDSIELDTPIVVR